MATWPHSQLRLPRLAEPVTLTDTVGVINFVACHSTGLTAGMLFAAGMQVSVINAVQSAHNPNGDQDTSAAEL